MQTAWTTADYALIVSLCSAALSLFSLGWNIWSKFIFPKAKLRVGVDLKYSHLASGHIVSMRSDGSFVGDFPGSQMSHPAIEVSVSNFGPGSVTLTAAVGRPKKITPGAAKGGFAVITAYNNYPFDLGAGDLFGGGLPKKLDVGEELSMYFPVTKDMTGEGGLSQLGVRDSFSRIHWIGKRQMRALRDKSKGHWNSQ